LGAERVAANQRLRLVGAGSDLLAERRLLGLTSRLICRRAGVSGHTFYEHFENVDALLTAAFANAAQLLVGLIANACAVAADRDEKPQKALAAAASLGAEEPGLVALMRLEIAVAIPEVGAERERLIGRLATLAASWGRGPASRAGVGAVLSIGHDRLEAGGETGRPITGELAGLLMSAAPDADGG
jgi:AcrR family transcriptional regulator